MSTKLINVEMPDGTIVQDVPEGTSQAEVLRRYKLTTAPAPAAAETSNETTARQLLVGASPSEIAERIKGAARSVGRVGMQALQFGQYLTGSKVSPTPISLEPSLDPNQKAGEMVGNAALTAAPGMMAAKAALPVQAAVNSAVGGMEAGPAGAVVGGAVPVVSDVIGQAIKRFPTTAKAGAKFQQVMAATKDEPIDTSKAEDVVARAQELRARGSSMPKVLNDFARNRNAALATEPMTYDAGRDFSSKAGELSASEKLASTPTMQRQVTQFAIAMKEANREAAVSVGMGDLYDAAMKEYRQAKTIQDAADVIKKWAIPAAATAAGLSVGGKVAMELWKSH